MKIVFISSSWAIIYLIYYKLPATYNRSNDAFRIEFLILPSLILSCFINHSFNFFEVRIDIYFISINFICNDHI